MFHRLNDKMYLNMICFIVSVCLRESCIKSWDRWDTLPANLINAEY